MAAQPSPARTLRVLVADDDATLRMVLRRMLEDRGHEVHLAEDAPAALAILESTTVDVALVDLQMPGEGRTVAERLTGDPSFGGHLFMMTGERGREDEVPTAEWIRKPFRFAELVKRVEARASAA